MLTLTQNSPTTSNTTTCDAPIALAHCLTGKPNVMRISQSVASTVDRPSRTAKAKANVSANVKTSVKANVKATSAGSITHSTEFKPARLSPVGAHLWTLSADEAALDIALDRMIDAVLGRV